MEQYKAVIYFNDGGENEDIEFSNIHISGEAIYMYTMGYTEMAGKYLEFINYIMMRSNDEKAGFPVIKKGNFKCKIMFCNKEEKEFEFIDYKANSICNNLDTLNDNCQLYLYPDSSNCILIPFSNVYQFAYKKITDPRYTIVRNYEINKKKGLEHHAILHKQLLW